LYSGEHGSSIDNGAEQVVDDQSPTRRGVDA